MSIENAMAFLVEAEKNRALRMRLGDLKGAGALKRLVTIAAESGFYFTEDEYRMAVIEAAQGELSEDSLNAVIKELRGG